jgi:hypothetical protein
MSLIGEAARSTKGRLVIGVVMAWAIFQLWLTLAAPGKISPELSGATAKVNVQVELPFAPERFHIQALQKFGRIAGADEHSVALRGVKREDLTSVARPYWVTAVGPIKEGG